MKMKIPHIIPLSRQALDILRELHPLTGNGNYVFPSEQTKARSMSDNTVNAALRRLGYGVGEMTGHGFRSMASTLLNERGWDRDAVERQLAHTEKDNVRAAYNYAQYLPERRKMMQAWADYLDELRVHISAASYAEPRERAVNRFGQQTTDSFRPGWPPNPESRSQAIPPRERRS
jgi:integrase